MTANGRRRRTALWAAAVAALLLAAAVWMLFPALMWGITDAPIFRMMSTELPLLWKKSSVSVKYDNLTDSRDGKKYKTVKMPDGKTWMAENLKYKADSSCCYNNDFLYCYKYGRLYTWNAAMHACPAGWRLPSREEWDSLAKAVGGELQPCTDWDGNVILNCDFWAYAGKKLKTKIGWDYYRNSAPRNGTDDFGFSALPGGLVDAGYYNDARFVNIYDYGVWWTATADTGAAGLDLAYSVHMSYETDWLRSHNSGDNTSDRYSVRCVKD